MKNKDELLMIFVRNPVVGRVKSRLANGVGEKAALKIYIDLMTKIRDNTILLESERVVFFSDFISESDCWPNSQFSKHIQDGESIGERMSAAFRWAFDNEYKKVVLIGTDIYKLSHELIAESFHLLDSSDIILGPTFDGGYYLIGMKTMNTHVFENISWGGEHVFNQTIRVCNALKLKIKELAKLADIDEIEDFKFLDPIDQGRYLLMIEESKKGMILENYN